MGHISGTFIFCGSDIFNEDWVMGLPRASPGPHVHFLILQITLVFIGIYGALLVLTFFSTMLNDCSTLVFVAYIVAALLPVLGILLRVRHVVTVMSIVGSIGTLRCPQVISAAIRKERRSWLSGPFSCWTGCIGYPCNQMMIIIMVEESNVS